MFIKIKDTEKTTLYVNKKEIVGFSELFEEQNGEKTLTKVFINIRGYDQSVTGTPEELNDIITKIVEPEPVVDLD